MNEPKLDTKKDCWFYTIPCKIHRAKFGKSLTIGEMSECGTGCIARGSDLPWRKFIRKNKIEKSHFLSFGELKFERIWGN